MLTTWIKMCKQGIVTQTCYKLQDDPFMLRNTQICLVKVENPNPMNNLRKFPIKSLNSIL